MDDAIGRLLRKRYAPFLSLLEEGTQIGIRMWGAVVATQRLCCSAIIGLLCATLARIFQTPLTLPQTGCCPSRARMLLSNPT